MDKSINKLDNNNQTKYPLVIKQETTRLTQTLEGREINKEVFGRRLMPSVKIDSLQDVQSYYDQLLQAMIHYGTVMSLPHCIENAVSNVYSEFYDMCNELAGRNATIHEYFSRTNILSPSDRDKRKEIYERIKNEEDWYSALKNISSKNKSADFQMAIDLTMELAE